MLSHSRPRPPLSNPQRLRQRESFCKRCSALRRHHHLDHPDYEGFLAGRICEVITVITSYSPISFVRYLHPVELMCIGCIYDGSSKVLFPLLALNRNSMRDAFCFTCKKSYTEHTSKMQ